MTIHLPENLESSILAAVHSGRFASVNDAMAEAARLLLREIQNEQSQPTPTVPKASPDPLLGAWREDADLLDEIVEHAMKVREERPWRLALGNLERVGRPIGRCDPMIAAIAITNGLELVTGNTAHYQRIQQLGYPLVLANWRILADGTTPIVE
jgi:Arc/MetJ-type ribon-helix-helix transcriptional regulator